MNKKLKQELKMAFASPTPTKKNKFLNDFPYPKTNSIDFVISQIGYIRKRFWLLSTFIVIAIILFIKVFDAGFKTIAILSSLLTFLVLLSVAEVSKSTSYNMAEIEMSCKYNLGKITLARLSFIGSFHFIIMVFMVFLFGNSSEYGFLRFSLYSITPFLLCSYFSLFIINHLQTKESLYICSGVTGVISIGVLILTANFEIIYSQKFVLFWTIIFIIIAVLLFIEVKNFMKRTGEFEWNSSLIA